ncbi:MAG: hypothetical protein ABJL99_01705 [Aliishimia sp.]
MALNEVFEVLLERPVKNAFALYGAPIDVDKPNQHDSKPAFNRELNSVKESLAHTSGLLRQLIGDDADSKQIKARRSELIARIDEVAYGRGEPKKTQNSFEILLLNARVAGFTTSCIYHLVTLEFALETRLRELRDQDAEFWSVSSRPPNYYARTISLRTARLYAKEKGVKPTLGTARDGGHPSTDFGRALESIFAVLGIKSNVRSPAKWAIGQLTDADLLRPQNAFAALSDIYSTNTPTPQVGLMDFLREKGSEK